jgi:hypothetical protein
VQAFVDCGDAVMDLQTSVRALHDNGRLVTGLVRFAREDQQPVHGGTLRSGGSARQQNDAGSAVNGDAAAGLNAKGVSRHLSSFVRDRIYTRKERASRGGPMCGTWQTQQRGGRRVAVSIEGSLMIGSAHFVTHGPACEVSIDSVGRCTLSITELGKAPVSICMPFSTTLELRELFNRAVRNGPQPSHVVRGGMTPQ